MKQTVFHGDQQALRELMLAVQHNCDCTSNEVGNRVCSAHTALYREQRFSDGLLFARRYAMRFVREEFVA